MDAMICLLQEQLPADVCIKNDAPLASYCTLEAGGRASWLLEIDSLEQLATAVVWCHEMNLKHLVIGSGSNILVSDSGFNGLVVVNKCSKISGDLELQAETGCWFQDLFLFAAQRGLQGLEFAVGIPGTLGGAIVSNAGAYQSNIADLITSVEIVEAGERRWVAPEYLQFSYRNSILRSADAPRIVLLSTLLKLSRGNGKQIYDAAREYQRQRIAKQPPHASAGSFFKNVYDKSIAAKLDTLPNHLREMGLVPAGYLIEACGLKGETRGHAIVSPKHANFICNVGGARAQDIYALAQFVKNRVYEQFGVQLEEEVLYVGEFVH